MSQTTKSPNRNDLRWQRTERHLLSAFAKELETCPLDKVKVTDICRQAEISKATFYLHYCDIYELADAFIAARVQTVLDEIGDPCLLFRDLSTFMEKFIEVMRSSEQEVFANIGIRNQMIPRFMDQLIHELEKRLTSKAVLLPEAQPHITLPFIIGGLMGTIQSCRDIPTHELKTHLAKLLPPQSKRQLD